MSLATCLMMWSVLFGQSEVLPAPLTQPPAAVPLTSGAILFDRTAPLPEPQPAPLPLFGITVPADATPEQQSHLERAIRELRAGGLAGLAAQLEGALETARQAEVKQTIAEKQAQLRVLEQEIALLQRQLPSEQQIVLQMMILKVNRDKLREVDPALNQQLRLRLLSLMSSHIRIHPDAKPLEIPELLEQLLAQKDSGAVIIRSRPMLRTIDGQEVQVMQGGDVPVSASHDPQPVVRYLDNGITVKVRPKMVTSDTVHCFGSFEQSDIQFDEAVIRAGGSQFPGVNRRQIAVQFTAKFGETVLFPTTELAETPVRPDAKAPLTLVFATIQKVEETVGVPVTAQPPTHQSEPAVLPAPAEIQTPLSTPQSSLPPQAWISPVQLLMRTLLETDTDRFVPPAKMNVDVKYYLAPPLPQPQQ